MTPWQVHSGQAHAIRETRLKTLQGVYRKKSAALREKTTTPAGAARCRLDHSAGKESGRLEKEA